MQKHYLADIIEPIVEGLGYDTVRILTVGETNPVIQIMIEHKDYNKEITVDDCATVSRALSATLDEKDPIENKYVLEVSSPGIDRPLTKVEHFKRYLGYLIKVETIEAVETVKAEAVEEIESTIASYVAVVGNVGYTSLANAVAEALAGQTVTLLQNVELSEILTLDKAITLEGNGYTLSSTAGRAINVDAIATVTINDLEVVGLTGCQRGINIINKASNVVLNNVTISGVSHYAVHVATSAKGVKVSINNSNLEGWGALAIYGVNTVATVNDSYLVGINNYTGESDDFATIAVGGSNQVVTVIGGEILAVANMNTIQAIVCDEEGPNSNNTILLDSVLTLSGENTQLVLFDDYENTQIKVRALYAEALVAEGYIVEVQNGMVTIVELTEELVATDAEICLDKATLNLSNKSALFGSSEKSFNFSKI